MLRLGLLAILLGACGAEIAGNANTQSVPDAANGGDDSSTTPDAPAIEQPDAPPAAPTCSSRRVYLAFEGITLTKGTSDAKTHHASWMTKSTATIPKWNANSGNRANDIAAVTAAIKTALATGFPAPIEVVTTEPTSGEYSMIVFGGDATNAGSNYNTAVQQLDCDDSETSDVAWIRDYNTVNVTSVANTALGAIGFGLGLTATNNSKDCMCSWANDCTKDDSEICTFTENIARDANADQTCAGAPATQNEHTAVKHAFCD